MTVAPPDNRSGFGRGQYADPEQVKTYVERMSAYLDQRNAAWLDRWQDRGEIPNEVGDLLRPWQADDHLVRWAIANGHLHAASRPEGGIKAGQVGRYTAIVYCRDEAGRRAIAFELKRYVDELERRRTDDLRAKRPDLFRWGAIGCRCCCPHPEPYECVRRRHVVRLEDVPDEPCDCCCHHGDEEDRWAAWKMNTFRPA